LETRKLYNGELKVYTQYFQKNSSVRSEETKAGVGPVTSLEALKCFVGLKCVSFKKVILF
jgi:hypothetical protein